MAKDKEEVQETEAVVVSNDTASAEQPVKVMAKAVGGSSDIQSILAGEENFDINDLSPAERLDFIREVILGEKQLEMLAFPIVRSQDIVGLPIAVHDAIYQHIPDDKNVGQLKLCVKFVCESKGNKKEVSDDLTINYGDFFTVMKGSNSFNSAYVERFNRLRGVALSPLENYNFVVDARYTKANNPSIVLRKLTSV